MKFCKSIIAFITAFSIFFSVLTIADASVGAELVRDPDSVDAWNTYFANNWVLGDGSVEIGGIQTGFNAAKQLCWSNIDNAFADVGLGSVPTYEVLAQRAQYWTSRHKHYDTTLFNSSYRICFGRPQPSAGIRFDTDLGVYRLCDEFSGAWLVNSMGYFLYYEPPKNEDGNVPAQGEDITGITWRPFNDAFGKQADRHLIARDVLTDLAGYYGGSVIRYNRYYVIVTTDPVLGGYLYLCDESGYPYCNVIDDSSTAAGTPNDYYVDNSMTITNNGQLIDVENGVVWFPDGTMYYIDQLIYDESTQSYVVDSHDQYTYNTISNSFNTTTYNYIYNFYITHTSIIYIGQTGEYEDPFELYYELPDGRSSADLTAEELEQLSLVFADVINYARSADDINMRALYHFDGNLDDSSYWSYCSSFEWANGASITYMDEGTFGGSLYLDEIAHEFSVVLPSADLSADFTIQFRYYQSYTSAPYMDSYIAVGSVPVLYLDGCALYDPDIGSELFGLPGTQQSSGRFYYPELVFTSPYSIGTWQEIALIREGDILYCYINGVCYGSWSLIGSYGDTITFMFGSEHQAYKKLDELRVTKGALVSGGESYTPSLVPYDTNLALILPDGEVPIADEYWTIDPSDSNLLPFNFLNSAAIDVVDYGPGEILFDLDASPNDISAHFYDSFSSYGLYTFCSTASMTQTEDSFLLSVDDPDTPMITFELNDSVYDEYDIMWERFPQNCLGLCISAADAVVSASSSGLESVFSPMQTYCFSVVDSAGNLSYVSFYTANSDQVSKTLMTSSFTSFDIYITGLRDPAISGSIASVYPYPILYHNPSERIYCGPQFIYIVPRSGNATIAYMELVVGSEPDYDLTWHEAVFSSGELKESPVLAVKSNTPVSDYQIGGVRPSYPTKGQVWALVENQRITSLQQYSGYAWLAVDGRIWTGTRWIPTGSFNVFTLQDLWDVQGTTPKDEYTYIYTESGFWDWWQKQWYSFTGTLFDKLDGSGGSGGDPVPDLEDDPLISEDDKQKFDDTEYTGIVKLLRQSYEFVSDFFSGFTMGGVQNFLSQLTDPASPIFGLFWMNGL